MSRITASAADLVRGRANRRCEYCHVPQAAYASRFCVDHAIAQQHGGETELENLAFCCLDCNLRKGPNIAGIDPESKSLTRLFHPRTDSWREHFAFDGAVIRGMTAVGRATASVLDLNSEPRLAVRRLLDEEGLLGD